MRAKKGNYKEKHPLGTSVDPAIAAAVKNKLIDNTITCADATDISLTLRKSMLEVGTAIDLIEGQIVKCQLGLFGYYPQSKIVSPVKTVDPKIEEAIRTRLIKGRLSCYEAWEIAKAFALPKIDVASVCEAMSIKITPCQLGTF